MTRKLGFAIGLLAGIVTLGALGGATAMTAGDTAQGERFVSGGIATGERDALEQRRQEDFNLWVVTAAKGSGQFLAGVDVRITGPSGKPVLDTTLDGPWLLVDLEPGQYTVEASHDGQSVQKSTTIAAGDHREMNFYFDVKADVLPR